MSFDLFFLPKSSVDVSASAAFALPTFSDGPATPQQAAQMRRLVEAVQQMSPDVIYSPSDRGAEYGAWLGYGSSALPDMDVRPDHLFMSMHFESDQVNESTDVAFREKVIAFLEALDYVCFDPQSSRLASSSDFSFSRRAVSRS